MSLVSALLTDFYELTMAQGYYKYGMNRRAVFDMFFRRQPFGGGFSVFAGLRDLLEALQNLRFSGEDLAYLEGLRVFDADFLKYLESFRFTGDLYAVEEGTAVFPYEPILRVHGSLIEAQLIESLLLDIVNFQTLIATKAARIYLASGGGTILEFGLRRAQGPDGAMSASRAAYIGGASATSNTLAGRIHGIPVSGTMAHSWVMAFDGEDEAFDKYADLYPDKTLLLIDTYGTLGSGVKNAIRTGLKLKALGKPVGVRLDSGDIEYLSKQVRKALDEAGLPEAKIAVSNELNEEIIQHLVSSGCPVDLWGVGTHLVTGGGDPSLTGVYKLAAKEKDGVFIPTMKVSDNPEKSTNPGIKQIFRYHDESGSPLADLIALDGTPPAEAGPVAFHHPSGDYRHFLLEPRGEIRPLLRKKMEGGKIIEPGPPIEEIRTGTLETLAALDPTYTRLLNPHVFKVSISGELRDLKIAMIEESGKKR